MGLLASSVIPLLSKWEEYLAENPDGDIPGFAQWILEAQPIADVAPQPIAAAPTSANPEVQAPLLLSRLHRMLELLSKPLAKELGLTNPLEFAVLIQVAVLDRPNKKQLSQELLIEGSTAVEITKRLTTKGLILEQADAKDRRSAQLSLTDKGRQVILQGHTKLEAIHSGFLDGLRPTEKEQLTDLLARLYAAHAALLS